MGCQHQHQQQQRWAQDQQPQPHAPLSHVLPPLPRAAQGCPPWTLCPLPLPPPASYSGWGRAPQGRSSPSAWPCCSGQQVGLVQGQQGQGPEEGQGQGQQQRAWEVVWGCMLWHRQQQVGHGMPQQGVLPQQQHWAAGFCAPWHPRCLLLQQLRQRGYSLQAPMRTQDTRCLPRGAERRSRLLHVQQLQPCRRTQA